MSDLLDPLTPADCDLRGLEYMPLLGGHLFGSDFYSKANDLEFRVAMTLWWAAWTQKPAASLPDDDQALCRLADLGRDMRTWKKVKKVALHGFVKCSDGRLYHKTLAEQALIAWEKRVHDRKRKQEWRDKKAAELAEQERSRLQQEQSLSSKCPTDGTGTGQSGDAENALNRRDGTGRDSNRLEPSPTESVKSQKPSHAREPIPEGITDAAIAWNYVCKAANWYPSNDAQRQNNLSILAGWLALGCSLELILDGIAQALKRDPSPTRSLKRFDSTILGKRKDQLGGELPTRPSDVAAITSGLTANMRAN